jgi:hypothetical protein
MEKGRPSKHTKAIAAEVCLRLAGGESLRRICKDEHTPAISTIMLWVVEDRCGFSEQYAKACEARLHFHADELLDIADDGRNDWMEQISNEGEVIGYKVNGEAVTRSRLRVDTRKWLLSKLLPKYRDKPDSPSDTGIAEALARLAEKLPG